MAEGTDLLLIGGIGSATGQVALGLANRKNARFQAQLNERNATQARLNATENAARLRRDRRRRMGAIRAQAGAQGTGFSGSVTDILADQAAEAEHDALLIEFAGEQTALEQDLRGRLARKSGDAALLRGVFGAGKSLLTAGFLIDEAGGFGARGKVGTGSGRVQDVQNRIKTGISLDASLGVAS